MSAKKDKQGNLVNKQGVRNLDGLGKNMRTNDTGACPGSPLHGYERCRLCGFKRQLPDDPYYYFAEWNPRGY